MSKYIFLPFLLVVLLACSKKVIVQSSADQITAVDSRFDTPKALLYEITQNDEQKGYLLGTVHLFPASEYDLSDSIKSYLPLCDKIFCELDFTKEINPFEIAQFATMEGDTLLSDLISTEDFERLDKSIQESFGIPLSYFNSWKPALLTFFLNSDLSAGEMDLVSMENNLLEWRGGIPTDGLETIQEQMALFGGFSYQKQAEDLLDVLDAEKSSTQFSTLFSAYCENDLDALEELLLSDAYFDQNQDVFLKIRNEKWVLKMDSIFERETAFFAVGAAHLIGENGLLQLLSNANYELRPIPISILEKK